MGFSSNGTEIILFFSECDSFLEILKYTIEKV